MKRGILLVLIITICMSSVVYADIFELNISRNKVNAGQTFDGVLRLNFSKPIDVNTNLIFKIDGISYSKKLKDAYDAAGITNFLPAVYEKTGSPKIQSDIVFDSPGSKVVSAIDFSRSSSISSFNKFSVSFSGETVSGSFPSLSFDVGNDGVVDYIYKGQPTGNFEAMDSSYLGEGIADQSKIIRGNNHDVYCEKIFLKPSSLFKINAKATKLPSTAAGLVLNATIKNFNDGASTFSDCSVDKCCTMVELADSFSCDLNYEVNAEGNYSICISAFNGESSTNYYNLAAHSGSSEVRGYHNGYLSNVDNFITASRMLYNNKIGSLVAKDLDASVLEDYISSSSCGSSCLIPLNVSSIYPGKIKLSNLNVEFEDNSGLSSINSFTPINSYGIRANYSGTIEVPLGIFNDVVAPLIIGTNHLISASLVFPEKTLTTSNIQFEVVKGPPILIIYSSGKPTISENVVFSSRLRSNYGKSIVSYNWDFGDGTNSSVSSPFHSFNSSKKYSVSLSVVDSDGNVGRDSIPIDVRPIEEVISKRIASVSSLISNSKSILDSSSAQVKDTAQILGIYDNIANLESNLTKFNNSVVKVFSNFSGSERTSRLNSLYPQLLSIESSIPIGLSQDLITFPSSISNVDDIPEVIGNDESERNNIFKAQLSADVTGEARMVHIAYANNKNENFVMIKKVINSGSGKIYEVLPGSSTKRDIISPKEGYEIINSNVINFGEVKSFIYTINGADLNNAINSKTIVVPSDINNEGENNIVNKPVNVKLKDDSSPLWTVLTTLLIIVLIIYFGLFFKGGLFNKKSARKFFKSDADYNAVRNFVINALAKGAKRDDIFKTLKTKGWKEDQVSAVINEFISSKKQDNKQQVKKF